MAARKKKATTPAGRDTFHVLTAGGDELATKSEAPHALTIAQRFAEKGTPTLNVVRRSLFGPAATLYRIDRDEHGTVTTTTLNAED